MKMKRLGIWLLVFIVVGVMLGACDDPLDSLALPEKEHLARYPEMHPIAEDMTDFKGLLHDTQDGYYAFVYGVEEDLQDDYLEELSGRMKDINWSVSKREEDTLLLTDEERSEVIYIEHAPSTNSYLFLQMSTYGWEDPEYRNKFTEIIESRSERQWRIFAMP